MNFIGCYKKCRSLSTYVFKYPSINFIECYKKCRSIEAGYSFRQNNFEQNCRNTGFMESYKKCRGIEVVQWFRKEMEILRKSHDVNCMSG